jgi:hypothetical protein
MNCHHQLLLSTVFVLLSYQSAIAAPKNNLLYIDLNELQKRIDTKPEIAASLLSAILEKEVTLFPSDILNPESGHGKPIVCIKTSAADHFLKEIQSTGLVFKKDPDGKSCYHK